jgi:serine/threonine protein kinase
MARNYNHNSEPTTKESSETNKIMKLENSVKTPPSWRLGDLFDAKENTVELDRTKSQYRLIKTLGIGGFGTTYLAQDKTDKLVAIKTLSLDAQQESKFEASKRDFYSFEVMALSDCKHPNIVQKIEFILEDNLPCLVMEYINGKTISQLVDEKGPLSEREALIYIKQIGEALKTVHAEKWLHRDIKPKNIIISSENKQAILIDFGIARQYRPNYGVPLTSFGSGGYAPYEQYTNGKEQGFYSDVHALAATLYFMLTNKTPKSAPERREQEEDILKPPKSLNNNISAAVNKAIIKGMARDPNERPKTIEQWLDMLPETDSIQPLIVEAAVIGFTYGLLALALRLINIKIINLNLFIIYLLPLIGLIFAQYSGIFNLLLRPQNMTYYILALIALTTSILFNSFDLIQLQGVVFTLVLSTVWSLFWMGTFIYLFPEKSHIKQH